MAGDAPFTWLGVLKRSPEATVSERARALHGKIYAVTAVEEPMTSAG